MPPIPFLKMHGLGNDFVVIDARIRPVTLTAGQVRALSDRRSGIGYDQLILIERQQGDETADAFMRIVNADGSEVSACGNATRCVARLLMEESGREQAVIATSAGRLMVNKADGDSIRVDMGLPRLDWRDIPLATPADTAALNLTQGPLTRPVLVSMGNPHCVFFVPDVEAIALAELGPLIEHHPQFPERTNVEVVQLLGPATLRMRVWERGAGITRACGTGACAALVAAVRRGVIQERQADIVLDGGTLRIAWQDDNHVVMTGPATKVFTGTFEPDLWRAP